MERNLRKERIGVVVSNEQRVEYGQPLFKVKKLDD